MLLPLPPASGLEPVARPLAHQVFLYLCFPHVLWFLPCLPIPGLYSTECPRSAKGLRHQPDSRVERRQEATERKATVKACKTCSKVVTLTRPGDGEDPGRTPARPEWGPANPFSPCPLWKFLRSCSLILSCRIVQWFLRFPLSSARLNPTSQPP